MNVIKSILPEAIPLDSLPRASHNLRRPIFITSRAELEGTIETSDHLTEFAPDDAATDQRPTRNYQIMLLLSGFFMTFHVIWINLVYGIFQVRFHDGIAGTLTEELGSGWI